MAVKGHRLRMPRRVLATVVSFLTAAVALVPIGPVAQAATATAPPPLKVVTFNTCGQSTCQSKQDLTDWAADLSSAILAYGPDVVGIQEVCGNQYSALAADLPGYTVDFNQAYQLASGNGCDHWDAPGTAEPATALEFGDLVFVKTSESPVFHNTIIYPDDPSIEYRPLECAEASDAGVAYQYCDAHLDGGLGGFNAQGLPEVINRMQYWGGANTPTVLAGDFNADPTDPNMGLLYQAQDGNGRFIEAEQYDKAYFTPQCRQLTSCRSGAPTTLPQLGSDGEVTAGGQERKFDYIFASAKDYAVSSDAILEVKAADGTDLTDDDHLMYQATFSWRTATSPTPAPTAPAVFTDPSVIGAGDPWGNAVDYTAGNFSGSGKADMVVRYADGTVMLYPGEGGGKFGTGQQLKPTTQGWYDAASMTAGDLDGDGADDGRADLLVRWNVGSVFLYPNDGAGGLGGSIPLLPAGSWSDAVSVGVGHVLGSTDTAVNDAVVLSDTRATAYSAPTSAVWAYPIDRSASGTYTAPTKVQLDLGGATSLSGIVDMTVGDFTGIGHAEILLRHVDGTLSLYGDNAQSDFTAAPVTVVDGRSWSKLTDAPTPSWQAVENIVPGDFDGTGKDGVVLQWMNEHDSLEPGQGQTEYLSSTGTAPGTLFNTPVQITSGLIERWTADADFLAATTTSSGDTDLITRVEGTPAVGHNSASPGNTDLYIGRGTGTFGANGLGPLDWATALSVGGFGSGGTPELLAYDGSAAGTYPVAVGDTMPTTPPTTAIAGLGSVNWSDVVEVVSGDFYGGPYSDLVIRYTDGSVLLYQNITGQNGSDPSVPQFAAPTQIKPAGTGGWGDAVQISAGDFNADGNEDLLVRWTAGSLFLYPGDGAGHFGGSVVITSAPADADLLSVEQGTVYGTAGGLHNIYRFADGEAIIDNGSANLTNPGTPTVTGTSATFLLRSADYTGAILSFSYQLDGGPAVSLDAFHNEVTVPLQGLTAGSHTLTVTATNLSGITSSATTYTFTDTAG